MFTVIIRDFEHTIEKFRVDSAREAYYMGTERIRFYAHQYRDKFFFLELPQLDLIGCAYTSLYNGWVIERK